MAKYVIKRGSKSLCGLPVGIYVIDSINWVDQTFRLGGPNVQPVEVKFTHAQGNTYIEFIIKGKWNIRQVMFEHIATMNTFVGFLNRMPEFQ